MACNCVVGFTDSMPKVLDGEKCRCSSDLLSYDIEDEGAEGSCKADRSSGVFEVIWSSDQAHLVDALAATGDEGRCSLRKATGSWQTSFDP